MSQIMDLREKRAKAWEAAKAFLDSRRGDDGMLSAEDSTTYDRMEADIVNLGKEVERLERLESMDAAMKRPTAEPITEKPDAHVKAEKSGRASDTYSAAFWNSIKGRNDYEIRNALQIGELSEGGYTVPAEFERQLIEALDEENIMRPLVHTIRTNSGDRKIPLVVSKGEAFWIEEEQEIPESDIGFNQITLSAHKLGRMIRISSELLHDSAFDLANYISRDFARSVGAAEEDAIINGDGSHKPIGLLHDTLGAELGVTAASGTAITADEILDLQHSLRSGYRRRACWIMNDATVKLLRKLKDANGNYMWQPGLQYGSPDTLLNQRVLTTSCMPLPVAGNKAIMYGDYNYYWLADREGRSMQRLNELYAKTDQIGFKITERIDGRLILPEAVKVLQMKGA